MDGQPTEAQELEQIKKLPQSMCTEMSGSGFQTTKDNLFLPFRSKNQIKRQKDWFHFSISEENIEHLEISLSIIYLIVRKTLTLKGVFCKNWLLSFKIPEYNQIYEGLTVSR